MFAVQTGGMANAPEPVVDPRRLQELEEVTREYGSYGRTRFGLGEVAMGAWMILAGVVGQVAESSGRFLLMLAAPLWFGVLILARRRYQRQGAVAPIEVVRGGIFTDLWPSPRAQGIIHLLFWSGLGAVSLSLDWSGASFYVAFLSHAFAFTIVIACMVATVLLTWRLSHGYQDTFMPAMMIILACVLSRGWRWFALAVGLAGVVSMARGGYEHRRYARLERRLAALRSGN